jgi:hypothetical protein
LQGVYGYALNVQFCPFGAVSLNGVLVKIDGKPLFPITASKREKALAVAAPRRERPLNLALT